MRYRPGEISKSIDRLFVQVVHLHRHRAGMLLRELGLHRGQPRILKLLLQQDGLKQKQIADHLQFKPATVTRMLQRMEKTGFVRKEQDKEDMRVSRIYLTDRGRKVKEDLEQRMVQLEKETFAGFNETEITLLYRFFKQMYYNLAEFYQEK